MLPAFALRWLKESGSGFLRLGEEPNRRVQDGAKRNWLCRSCEETLNRSETRFATTVFHPYSAESGRKIRYGSWMMHFCTSLSWRVANFYLEEGGIQDWGEDALRRIAVAKEAWRRVLLSQEGHAGNHQQHLIPLDAIARSTMGLPPNANRYFMRAIDMDVCCGGEAIFTYAKIGRFVVIGFVHEPNVSHWKGSKINANQGIVEPREFTLPRAFTSYMLDKARGMITAFDSISDRQAAKINESMRQDVDRYVASEDFRAMRADVEMFGSAAFSQERTKPK